MKRVINIPPFVSIVLFFTANALSTLGVVLVNINEEVRITLTTVAGALHGINTILLNNKYHNYKDLASMPTTSQQTPAVADAFDNFERLHAENAPVTSDNDVELAIPTYPYVSGEG